MVLTPALLGHVVSIHPMCYQHPRYTTLIKSQVEKTTWQQPRSKKVFASHLDHLVFRFISFRAIMLIPNLSGQSGQHILQASIIAIILFEIRSLRTDVMQRMGTYSDIYSWSLKLCTIQILTISDLLLKVGLYIFFCDLDRYLKNVNVGNWKLEKCNFVIGMQAVLSPWIHWE